MRAPLLFATLLVTACTGKGDKDSPSTSARIPANALAQVRWIEGTWKGVGADGTTQDPFYERYTLRDNTLVVEGMKDSSLQVTDTTIYQQRGDSLTNPGPGPRWIAQSVSSDSILFVPLSGAKNQFVWRRGDDSSWTAILDWPPADSVERHRVYRMTRVR